MNRVFRLIGRTSRRTNHDALASNTTSGDRVGTEVLRAFDDCWVAGVGETNVLGPDGLAAVLSAAGDYTGYHIMDPAGTGAARNPFMQWWAVSKMGQKICVREWPQPGDYIPGVGAEKGVWAESGGSADGKRGPGQEWFGLGLEDLAIYQTAKAALRKGEANFVIVIPENFERDVVRGENPQILVAADASDQVGLERFERRGPRNADDAANRRGDVDRHRSR